MMPFGVSILAAYATWDAIEGIPNLYRMIAMALAWIASFAGGTRLFWEAAELLAVKT